MNNEIHDNEPESSNFSDLRHLDLLGSPKPLHDGLSQFSGFKDDWYLNISEEHPDSLSCIEALINSDKKTPGVSIYTIAIKWREQDDLKEGKFVLTQTERRNIVNFLTNAYFKHIEFRLKYNNSIDLRYCDDRMKLPFNIRDISSENITNFRSIVKEYNEVVLSSEDKESNQPKFDILKTNLRQIRGGLFKDVNEYFSQRNFNDKELGEMLSNYFNRYNEVPGTGRMAIEALMNSKLLEMQEFRDTLEGLNMLYTFGGRGRSVFSAAELSLAKLHLPALRDKFGWSNDGYHSIQGVIEQLLQTVEYISNKKNSNPLLKDGKVNLEIEPNQIRQTMEGIAQNNPFKLGIDEVRMDRYHSLWGETFILGKNSDGNLTPTHLLFAGARVKSNIGGDIDNPDKLDIGGGYVILLELTNGGDYIVKVAVQTRMSNMLYHPLLHNSTFNGKSRNIEL